MQMPCGGALSPTLETRSLVSSVTDAALKVAARRNRPRPGPLAEVAFQVSNFGSRAPSIMGSEM